MKSWKSKPFYKWYDEDVRKRTEVFFEKHGWYLVPIFLIPLVIFVILATIPYLISVSRKTVIRLD